MKKIIGILTILFVFVMTSFSQNHVYDVDFSMTLDGVSTNDFTVTHNLEDRWSPGTLMILFNFDDDVSLAEIHLNDAIDIFTITEYYKYPFNKAGIFMIKIDFNVLFFGTVNIVATSHEYNFVNFTEQDTIKSFNNGVKSVDTQSFYDMGVASVNTDSIFNDGVKSVDTQSFYDMGVASVNTDSIFNSGLNYIDTTIIWNSGYNTGVASVNTDSIFKEGVTSVDTMDYYDMGVNSVIIPDCICDTTTAYYNGVSSVNTDSVEVFYDIGFEDGKKMASTQTTDVTLKSAFDMNVNVYPNPVNNNDIVNIDCFNYSHVDVYTITGQTIIKGLDTPYIYTDNLESGVYFLNVWNDENDYSIFKIVIQ